MAVSGNHDPAARPRTQQSGCRDPDEAFTGSRATSWRIRTYRSETPLVGLERPLHCRASGRQDPGRCSQERQDPHRGGTLTTTMKHFDAIIIGTGQAGPSLAARFAGAGKTVAIIERGKF